MKEISDEDAPDASGSVTRRLILLHLGSGVGWLTGEGPPKRAFRAVSYYGVERISRMRFAASDGVLPTLTPAASRASFFACAVPAEPETMAPAWPMVLPSGAVKPAT